MLMKLLGVCCAMAATGTVLVYGFGLQVQRPITPLQADQAAPPTTPRAPAVASAAPVRAPEVEPRQVNTSELAATVQQPPENATVVSEITVSAEPLAKQPSIAQPTVAPPSVAQPSVTEPIVAELESSEATADQHFVFWQPFRSRGSAQGFAQGLSARAQVPISVISEETDTGRHYRVVLPYASEGQRLERLAKLESATRLVMGE